MIASVVILYANLRKAASPVRRIAAIAVPPAEMVFAKAALKPVSPALQTAALARPDAVI